MNIMLLCAGEGTRFRPHTLKLPKPALPFLNVPMVYFSLAALTEAQPERLIYNTFHLPAEMKKIFEPTFFKFPRPPQIENSFDGEKILGSAGGLKKAEAFFAEDEDFILCNGDEIILPKESGQIQRAMDFHRREKNLATLLVMEHPEVGTQFGGIWEDHEGVVGDIGKETIFPSLKGSHFIGISILNRRIFDLIPEGKEANIFYDVLKSVLNEKSVRTFQYSGSWYETGNLKSYLDATKNCLLHMKNNDIEGKQLEKVINHFSPSSELFENDDGALIFTSKTVNHQLHNNGSEVHDFGVIDPIQNVSVKIHMSQAVLGSTYKLYEDNDPQTLENKSFEKNLFI